MSRRFVLFDRIDRLATRLFPEREFHYRANGRVRYFTVPRRIQVGLAVIGVLLLGWSVFTSFWFVTYDHVLRDRDLEVAEARKAQRELAGEVKQFNQRLQAVTRNLERSRAELMKIAGPAANKALAATPAPVGAGVWARVDKSQRELQAQIRLLSSTWTELSRKSSKIENGMRSIGTDIEGLIAKHGAVTHERDLLKARVGALRARMDTVRTHNLELVSVVAVKAEQHIDELENVIRITGLDSDELVSLISQNGKGGPETASAAPTADSSDELSVRVARLEARYKRWEALKKVVRNLPLTAPLDHYRKSSGYGTRRDPFTGRISRHNGLDFAYHYNTPVMATAPGQVVFAGWRGGYGWFVEIDHGMGLRTRYAHLRKLTVQKGDIVAFRQKVGLLGSSGRSSGPHVHYEIVLNGKPQDPRNFILAGKYVYKN